MSPKPKIRAMKKERASFMDGNALTYSDEYSFSKKLNAGGEAIK